MTLRLRSGAATDVGRVRQVNQDAFLVEADRGLYAVADGMGGHRGGEVASQLAIEALRGAYDAGDDLAGAIAAANVRIFDQGAADPNLQGMGTTVVAAAVLDGEDGDTEQAGGQLLVANVGDSRAYLFRDGELTQLTEDHSMVADLLREGRISEAEAEVHPQRNIVTRVLGVYEQVDVDLWPVDALAGDRVLLCSDGLVNEVTSDQIAAVLRRLADPDEAAAELVRRANEGGGRDNITVVLLDVVDDGGVAAAASAALAGETTATSRAATATAEAPAPAHARGKGRHRREDDADEDATGRRTLRERVTWRSMAFVLGVLAVIAGAFLTIQWYGTSTYFVGLDGDEVVIYQGRPGGLLWIDPSLERRTGIDADDVPSRYRRDLEDGREQSSLAEARRYVSNIERDIRATTTTTTTTTTLPVDPSATVPTTPAPPP
jgi:serine/threonine protein phosphatase PrpC